MSIVTIRNVKELQTDSEAPQPRGKHHGRRNMYRSRALIDASPLKAAEYYRVQSSLAKTDASTEMGTPNPPPPPTLNSASLSSNSI